MEQTKIRIDANPHPGQLEVHRHPARFKVLACGRRWGKTRLGVNECLDVAAKGGRAWWVAPTYKMSEVGWRPLRQMASRIGAEVRRADRQIVLPSGGEISVRSADTPDSLRGDSLDFLVVDECSFTLEETWTEALRPALSDRKGKAMFISTPTGRNWFWRLWQRGLENESEWKSWQFPTSANPYIDKAEIESARETLPELTFEQEYLAVFLEHEGAVFRNILACMNAQPATPDQHKDHHIVAGIDWGKQNDYTCISVGCADCRTELDKDRFNQIDYSFQRARLNVMLSKWNPTSVLAETNAMGDPLVEMLQQEGLPVVGFQTTAISKPPLIENMALALERSEWQFLPDAIWTAELEAYERKVSPTTGRSAYSAPSGVHDDTVIGRCLMVWQATNRISLFL